MHSATNLPAHNFGKKWMFLENFLNFELKNIATLYAFRRQICSNLVMKFSKSKWRKFAIFQESCNSPVYMMKNPRGERIILVEY